MASRPDVTITSILITMVAAVSLPAATAAAPAGRLAIVNANSGLCLTIAGGGRDLNAQAVQYTCDEDPSRSWSLAIVSGTDIVAITNLNSGLCLTVAGGSTGRNVAAVQYGCDGDPSRQWRLANANGSAFQLVNVHSGLCLTIAGGGTERNTTAVQYPCDGDRSRDWQLRAR